MSNSQPPNISSANTDLMQQCEQVLQLTLEMEPNLREISERTQEIAPLSSAVLEKVNSATLGLQHTIQSVDQAVALLGAKRMSYVIENLLGTDYGERQLRRAASPQGTKPHAA